jgi:hypothetical protein
MRSSIINLLLFISFSLLAFQPPEQPKSQLVTFAELQEEREKNRESYLSLLPNDLLKQIHDYMPNNLEETVHAIRSYYLNNPAKRETFLNDEALNAQLINELTLRFRIDNTEHITRVYNQESALMLNTPASFEWLRKTIPEDRALATTTMYGVIELYLNRIRFNYQQALDYVKHYLENSKKVAYDLSGLTLDVVPYLIKNFNEPHEHVTIPEIQALADIATYDARNWIRLILENSTYFHENERLLRVLLKSQKNQFDQGQYEPVRNAVCLSLANLLTRALHNADHQRIAFIKNIFSELRVPHASYKKCIAEHFEWLKDANGKLAVRILINAITAKQVDVIRALTEGRYVNVNACDKFGHNALWYARNLETDAATRLAIIELLQQAGVSEEEKCVIQ